MATTQSPGQPHDRIPPGNGALDMPSAPKITRNAAPATDVSIGQKMGSAVSGSILTSLLVTPLDVVRVRLQAQQGPSPSTRLPSFIQLPPNLGVSACCRQVFWVQNQSQFCVASPSSTSAASPAIMEEMLISDCAAEETQRRTFNSTLDGLRKITRNEGILTLWRGLSPTLAMAVPANIIYFAGYDWLRTSSLSPFHNRVSDTYAPLVAGSTARISAAICVSPIEMLRTRMQASSSKPSGGNVLRSTITGLQEMVANEGYRSLWRGLSLTLWRDVPFSAFYWWGYEYGRDKLHAARENARPHDPANPQPRSRSDSSLSHRTVLVDSFLAGAGSGAIAALATTPFDVGKTRQQTVLHSHGASKMTAEELRNLPENRTMPRFLLHIFQQEGLAGLFKGWAARCLKVAPACAIMISSYEIGKKMASRANEGKEVGEQD